MLAIRGGQLGELVNKLATVRRRSFRKLTAESYFET
jgi:hypothetical protein